jgi:GNAT superfamily N-acetyltransferase
MQEPLDNPVWHALAGPHATRALGHGAARLYPRDMAPFDALEHARADAHAALARHLPAGLEAHLFRPASEPTPARWETISERPIRQMVLSVPKHVLGIARTITAMSEADVPDMLDLAEMAKPGPFGPRAHALGRFVGVRDAHGQLVAMAGERFRLAQHVELCAIAVHPAARGSDLGAALTIHLANEALARGLVPFLHVFPDKRAGHLDERLGFRERARLIVVWRRPIHSE